MFGGYSGLSFGSEYLGIVSELREGHNRLETTTPPKTNHGFCSYCLLQKVYKAKAMSKNYHHH